MRGHDLLNGFGFVLLGAIREVRWVVKVLGVLIAGKQERRSARSVPFIGHLDVLLQVLKVLLLLDTRQL